MGDNFIGEPEIDAPEQVTGQTPIDKVISAINGQGDAAGQSGAELNAAPAGDPVADQFTWENQDAQKPGYLNQYLEQQDIEMPSGSNSANYPGAPAAVSAKAGGKGITDHGIAQTQKLHGFNGIDERTAATMAPEEARQAGVEGQLNKAYASSEDAVAQQRAAYEDHYNKSVALMDRQADFYNTQQHVEAQALQQSQADREAYVSSIHEQLAGVRALMAQNANPLSKLRPDQGFTLGMAQFAQGFLASRGVQIDVSGQVDKWVDRELQQHQQNIQNARSGVQDTMSLYNIARQSSQDDQEARQRMRAFVIEGFQARLQAEGDRFQSSLASSKAQEQIAKLEIEKNSTLNAMGDRHFQQVQEVRKGLVTEAAEQGKIAIEAENLDLKRKEFALKQAKPQKNGRLLIKDPEQVFTNDGGKTFVPKVPVDPKTGKPAEGYIRANDAKWEVDPNLPDAIKTKVYEKAEGAREDWSDYQRKMDKVLELRNKVHQDMMNSKHGGVAEGVADALGYTNDNLRRRTSPAYDEYRAAVDEMIAAQLKAETGVAANAVEIKNMQARYPDEKVLSNHSGAQIFLNARENSRGKFETRMEGAGVVKVDSSDPERYTPATTASEGLAKDYANGKNGGPPIASDVQNLEAEASRGSSEPPDAAVKQNKVYRRFVGKLQSADDSKGRNAETTESEYAFAFDQLAKFAASKQNPEAVEALTRLAGDDKLQGDRREYAKYLLDRVKRDPQALLDDYSGESDKFH